MARKQALLILLALPIRAADGHAICIPSRDGGVTTFSLKQDMVTVTVILLRGGAGGIGVLEVSGWPGTRNFLIHTGKLFAASGFNFAMTIKPSDALRIRLPSCLNQ